MIEAMACGTPVIALHCGSVPEVIDHGVTGFIVDDEDEAVAAVEAAGELDRATVRATFERRFTVERMAADYLSVYRSLPGVRRDAARLRRAGGDEVVAGGGVAKRVHGGPSLYGTWLTSRVSRSAIQPPLQGDELLDLQPTRHFHIEVVGAETHDRAFQAMP